MTQPTLLEPIAETDAPHDVREVAVASETDAHTTSTTSPISSSSKKAWPQWLLLGAFSFIALESLLMAVTMQGRWFIVLAPGAVCAVKALEMWRQLRSDRAASMRTQHVR